MAVVVDFDGTLVKSMELHAEAYRRALAPFKVQVTDQEIFEREGARSETIIGEYLARIGINGPDRVRRVANEKQEIYKGLGPPPLYPGAKDFVQTVRKAVPRLGIVTGTRRENLDRLIPELMPLFDAVVAQDAYTNDKPHPEPYLNAAAKLGVDPRRCAALENATRGVKSALAAGYAHVVAVPTTMDANTLRAAGAHVVARDLAEAAKRLTDWVRITAAR